MANKTKTYWWLRQFATPSTRIGQIATTAAGLLVAAMIFACPFIILINLPKTEQRDQEWEIHAGDTVYASPEPGGLETGDQKAKIGMVAYLVGCPKNGIIHVIWFDTKFVDGQRPIKARRDFPAGAFDKDGVNAVTYKDRVLSAKQPWVEKPIEVRSH